MAKNIQFNLIVLLLFLINAIDGVNPDDDERCRFCLREIGNEFSGGWCQHKLPVPATKRSKYGYEIKLDQSYDRMLPDDVLHWAKDTHLLDASHTYLTGAYKRAPMTLFPSRFPRSLFEEAVELQQSMSLLYFRASNDHEFLAKAYESLAGSDETIKKLLELWREIQEEGIRQPVQLLWQRADYMTHWDQVEQKFGLKQLKVTIGTDPGWTAEKVSKLHRRVAERVGMEEIEKRMPRNTPFEGSAEAVHQAWLQFGDPDAIVVIIQRWHSTKQIHTDFVNEISKLDARMKPRLIVYSELDTSFSLAENFSLRVKRKTVAVVFYLDKFLEDYYIKCRHCTRYIYVIYMRVGSLNVLPQL